MKDYDVVVLIDSLDQVPSGSQGVILMTHVSKTTGMPEAYEVEFFNDADETIAVETVLARHLAPATP